MSDKDSFDMYRDLVSPASLLENWDLEAHRSTVRGRDGLSPQQFLRISRNESLRISNRLIDGSWDFIAYKQVLKSRGPIREPRVISVPSARDRAPLKALSKYVRETVLDSRGQPSQDKISEVAQCIRSGEFHHFVRVDVQDFYPSINHSSLFAAIDQHIKVESAQKILRRAVATPTLSMQSKSNGCANEQGVPQGLSISNVLAELVLSEVDRMFDGDSEIRYFRYIDDIFVLTKRKMNRKIYRLISSALSVRGLKTHPLARDGSKSTWGVLSSEIDFLGYSLSSSKVSVRTETVNRLKSRIAMSFVAHSKDMRSRSRSVSGPAWEKECDLRLEWYLNVSIAGCVLDGHRRGWIHYFSLINDFSLLRVLDHFVQRQLEAAGLSLRISVKKFVQSYRRAASLRRDNSGYVVDFDKCDSESREWTLCYIFRYSKAQIQAMSEQEIEAEFFRRVRSELDSLETDLSLGY